ncbi:isoprenylcysteine carboxylmethyltransferase family protein [bacterium]|nr:isoprenylcysteine carboxylmethyltransferase family protein [bacterium]
MGKRGEGWVAIQAVIFAAIFFAPRCCEGVFPLVVRIMGWSLFAASGLFATWAFVALGSNLTPFPKPVEGNQFVRNGPFGIVRHPIYTSVIFGSLGWSLGLSSWPGIGLSILLFLFFELKSRREERWLEELHEEYRNYKRSVHKIIPFLY